MSICAEIFHVTNPVIQFNTLARCLSGLGKVNCAMLLTRKRGCSKIYILTWNYLKKVFSTILDIKNASRLQKNFSQNSTKDHPF